MPPNKSQKFLITSVQFYCFLKSLTIRCTGQMGSVSSILLVTRESSFLDTFQKRIRQCCEVVPCNLRHCVNIHFPFPQYIPGGLDSCIAHSTNKHALLHQRHHFSQLWTSTGALEDLKWIFLPQSFPFSLNYHKSLICEGRSGSEVMPG